MKEEIFENDKTIVEHKEDYMLAFDFIEKMVDFYLYQKWVSLYTVL